MYTECAPLNPPNKKEWEAVFPFPLQKLFYRRPWQGLCSTSTRKNSFQTKLRITWANACVTKNYLYFEAKEPFGQFAMALLQEVLSKAIAYLV